MSSITKIRYFEIALYLFIGVLAIGIPLFIHIKEGHDWNFVFREWVMLSPFFIVFLVNNFLLVPKLLLKTKSVAYIVSCIILLISVCVLNDIIFSNFSHRHPMPKQEIYVPLNDRRNEPPRDNRITERPDRFGPKDDGFKKPQPPHKRFFNFNVFIISFLIIGFNSGVKIFIHWISEKDKHNEKERHYLNAELAFLKHQVSPHFFMNTLNNIHALVDIDAEKAKEAIIKLSRLMRYLLYESNEDIAPLSKELEFLQNYIELMRLRYDEEKLSIYIKYPQQIENINVPSLLFLPVIENIFKHGVHPDQQSVANIIFEIKDGRLTLNVMNNYYPNMYAKMEESTGIGLENIRKRLSLIYNDNYSLQIKSSEEIFEITLSIPIV